MARGQRITESGEYRWPKSEIPKASENDQMWWEVTGRCQGKEAERTALEQEARVRSRSEANFGRRCTSRDGLKMA